MPCLGAAGPVQGGAGLQADDPAVGHGHGCEEAEGSVLPPPRGLHGRGGAAGLLQQAPKDADPRLQDDEPVGGAG